MRVRHPAMLLAAAATLLATPALAHPEHDGGAMPPPQMPMPPMTMEDHGPMMQHDMRPDWNEHAGVDHQRMRGDWLAECRRRYAVRDDGLGGAIIGGVIGGVAGNRIAGRGHRAVGTIIGAGVGAVAGAAIDRAGDRGRTRDYCESYFDYYAASYHQGGGGYAYGYAAPMMMVPVMMVQQPGGQRQCTETVVTTEEWVTVPARHRTIYRRPVVRDKRVRIVPDKRVAS